MSDRKISVTLDIGADIAKVRAAANELSQILNKSNFNSSFSGKMEGMISKLNGALSELEVKSSKAMTGLGDTKSVETSINKVNTVIKNITAELNRMGTAGSDSLLKLIDGMDEKWSKAGKAQREYTKALKDTDIEAKRLARDLENAQSKSREANRKVNSEDAGIKSIEESIKQLKAQKEALKSSGGLSYESITSDLETAKEELKNIETIMSNIAGKEKFKLFKAGDTSSFSEDQLKQLTEYGKLLDETTTKIKDLENQQSELSAKRKEFDAQIRQAESNRNSAQTRQGTAKREYEAQEHAIEELQEKIKNLNASAKDTAAFENYKQKLKEIFGDESLLKAKNIDELNTALEELKKNGATLAASELQKLLNIAGSASAPLSKMGNEAHKTGIRLREMTDRASEIDMLTHRLKYFFSLAGGFNLLRRAVRSAVTTTKELDAVMTQTAVVSNYSVSDMWKMLPQYSKEAKKLGVAIKDVYSAQTLYVQQGLDMNSAMKIGTETLKMSRVANISASEATNSMTAALRGFNMELTERSAKRVNDVYSKLAQNTASNTQEISTAMTKTAALANSANMSFENTAAFLATIIESTREGAETAGTALKTVIARFTEVKKLYSQGELLGTDEEGQEVNVNKISAALRTAGINMNEFFTGAKGLDEIFMELGSKWDSLTTVQQRYIATMAAGSRQQSRFLALMQNYSRTVELTQMAYNSAGSGQEQFDKTLDSLEAKVNKFKDAWDTFIMSLANSDAIKGIVDLGTGILDLLNNLIDKISGGNGAIKSILSLGSAFGIFKVGRSLVKGLVNTFKGEQSKGLFATLQSNRAANIKRFSDLKTGFQQPLFTFRKGVGANNRETLINAENRAKEEAQVAKTAYDNEIKELNRIKSTPIGAPVDKNGKPLTGAAATSWTNARQKEKDEAIAKQQEKVGAAEDDLNNKNEEVTKTSQESAAALQNYGAAMSAVGVAAGVAAGALGLWANHLEETGKSDAAKVVKGLALGLGVLSAALMVAGSAFQAFGAAAATGSAVAATAINAIPIVGWIIGIVTVLTTAGTIIAQFVETAKEKLENAKKAVEEHAAYLSELKDKYSEVSDAITSIGEQQDAIANMTERTLEWSDAVEALNKNLKDFISDYPEYANAVQFDERTGQLTLDLKTAKEIQEKQAKIIEQNEQEQRALKINQAEKQYKVDLETYGQMYVPDYKGGISRLSEKYYSSGFSKYNSQFFNKFGRSEYRFTKEDLIGLNDAFSTDFLNEFFGDENFLKERIELLKNAKAGDEVGDLANFFMEIRSLVGQAESYKKYQDETKNIARPEAVSYALNAGNYSGVVKSVAQQIYEKAHDQAFNNYSIKDVDQTMKEAWAERNHYTLVGTDQYSYQENGATVIKKIDNEVVLRSAQYEAATQAAKQATDQFFQGIANESYAMASGKGTYGQYREKYYDTLEQRDGQYYVKAGQEEKYQLYNDITDKFLEARKRISTVAGTGTDKEALRGLDTFYQDLNYLQTTGIANLVESWQSKFGTSGARGLLSGIEEKLKNTNRKELSNVTNDLLNILQQVESGAITSLEDFNQALLDFGLEGFNIDIGYVFKKPKTFEQTQEAIKSGLELWNTARTSNVFGEEDMNSLIASGQMSKGDFILTSQGYVSTKSQAQTTGAAKSALIDTTESAIGNLNNQIEVIDKFNKGYERWTNASAIQKEKAGVDLNKINNILSSQDLEKEEAGDIRNVLTWLLGSNGKVYNKNTGQLMNISDIADNDLAGYLSDILANQDTFTLRSQRANLEAEKESILDNKLLDMAPAIQEAVVNIISQATEKGIDITDNDIEQFVGGRAQFGSDKKYAEFLNGLDQLDWDEIDDIDDFTRKLKDLGIEFNDTGDGAQNLFNRLQEIYATDTTPAQKAEKQLVKVEKAKSAAERLASGEKVFSKEDVDNLRDVLDSKFNESEWKQTGSNEWLYVGEQTNSILSNIDGAVQAIAGKIINEAKEGVEKGQKIQGIIDSTQWPKSNGDKRPWGHAAGEIFAESTLKTFNDSALQDLAKYLDIGTQDEEGNPLERESLISLILDYYNKYYGENGEVLAANTALVGSAQTTADTLLYQQSGQGLLNNTDVTDEKRSEVLSNRVQGLGAGEQYMAQQDIAALSKDGKDLSNVINALTIDSTKAAQRFDNLTQSYKENESALSKEKKGTREYGLALGNLTKSVKTAFGNNEKITEEFVDNHLDLFKDYANGVDGAEDKIRQAMMDEGIIEGTTDQLNQLQATIDGIDGEQLTINGTADCSQAFSELAALYGSAEAAAAAMESLGYSVTWEPDGETTMEMPDGSTRSIPNYKAVVKDNAGNALNRNKGGGGGGGGGKKEFKNDFDKYYNQVEDINELERQRNLLESDYQQLLKSRIKSGKEIYDNLKKQIELLEEQRFLVDDLAEKRKQQIFDTMKDEQYKDVAKYAWWNEEDQTIEIDWQSINKIKDSETGDLVKEYVGKLEDFQSKYDEQIEALEDIEDTLQEIAERGKEEYTSLEDRVRDALIQKIQDQIEDLTKVNEAINEANQKVLDSISETLELQRQERENAKTEESLADKEQRLAYLRQDSSNANAVEIARLEKELEEERENYTDTLIDQKISELQKQNEKAQEQRQQQIDLMQESLDYQEKTGAFWDQVYQYINQGIDALGQLVQGSALQDLLMGGEGITGLSQIGQMEWLKELEGQVAQAVGYLYLSRQLEKVGTKEGTTITFTNAEGQELTGVVDSKGNVTVTKEDGSKVVYKNVYQDYTGKYRTLESEADAVAPEEPATTTKPGGTERPPVYQGSGTGKDWSIKKVGSAWSAYNNVNHGEYATEAEARSAAYEKNKAESIWGVKLVQNRYSPSMLNGSYTFSEAQSAASRLNAGLPVMTKYATGGLNTHTGPAWLDGTKSHPELVLNARDTENFIQLKDTLATFKANGGLNLAGGDNYYDIVVNVDQMSSDYDVDRAIDRIKARLYQDGAYRNVNTLSRLR